MSEPAGTTSSGAASGAKKGRHQPPFGGIVPPTPSIADFHAHTLRSDGILTPGELVRAAAAAGVRLLAITDHDTLAGVRELRRSGEIPEGLEVVPGIEINTVVAGDRVHVAEGEVHVLGIGVDPDDEALEAALARQRDARRIRFEKMVTRLRDQGIPIDRALETLPVTTDEDALGRPRIARALIECGYATSVEDAFNRHLSRGRPAYVPREGLGPRDAIAAIRSAGGLASLAHYAEAPDNVEFLRELIDLGLNGMEVHYRAYNLPTVTTLNKVATELRLLPTGGTDYHGDRETYTEAHAQLWIPDDIAEAVRTSLEVPV